MTAELNGNGHVGAYSYLDAEWTRTLGFLYSDPVMFALLVAAAVMSVAYIIAARVTAERIRAGRSSGAGIGESEGLFVLGLGQFTIPLTMLGFVVIPTAFLVTVHGVWWTTSIAALVLTGLAWIDGRQRLKSASRTVQA